LQAALARGWNGLAWCPSIDAMQEFNKMELSGYSAEFGRFAGGILTMVLSSGTNDFHGSLFHYLRNDQFGAMLSGPLRRNRAFFLEPTGEYRRQVGASGREGGPRVFQAALSYRF
jgi:hypothetical protein